MPAKSKAQFRFMEMLAHNSAKMKMKPKGLTPEKAQEYVSHNVGEDSYKNLPERFPKLKKRIK